MADLILHHYALSPFAEKIRAILGYKRLSWRSVDIPIAMPKPDLTALTGGYRKTPVLQVGCDIYCDTIRIARVLDELHPERPVFRDEYAALAVPMGRWLDHNLFLAVIALFFDPAAAGASADRMGGADAVARFVEDRSEMMRTARVRPPRVAEAHVIVADCLRRFETQLAARGPFLSGDAAGWVDFCAYHSLWAMRTNAGLAPMLRPFPALADWMARMSDFGHGAPVALDAAEAIAIARSATPRPAGGEVGPPIEGAAIGDTVRVAAADYALEPSTGTLVQVGPDEVAIRRVDERAGEVVVHFPRIGYTVRAG